MYALVNYNVLYVGIEWTEECAATTYERFVPDS